MDNLSRRIFIDVAMALCVIYGWWLVFFPLGIVSLFVFPAYSAEFVIVGVAYDALFGMGHGQGVAGFAGTIASVVISLVAFGIKKMVRS